MPVFQKNSGSVLCNGSRKGHYDLGGFVPGAARLTFNSIFLKSNKMLITNIS